jgi:ribosomal protection tetracycline resistance protein
LSSFLNLGIVAHVDAGKTSLTERLLFDSGVTERLGRVDAGTTRTDSLELERRRGITIRAAVTSFPLGDVTVNLLDTPGHPDFIAEVERSLAVLDAAVLVVSAVEGVQPQTVVIWRALRRIGVPTVLFVNKVDRSGSDIGRVLDQVHRRLTPGAFVLTRVSHQGCREVSVEVLSRTAESVLAAAAESDDRVLADWVSGRPTPAQGVLGALRRGVRSGQLLPVVHGSAITGAGVAELQQALLDLVPPAPRSDGPSSGTVFAVDRDARGRRAWIRLWSGELRLRDRVALGEARPEIVTELAVSRPGGVAVDTAARAGEIVVVRGPAARIGDHFGRPPRRRTHAFAPASLQALVEPVDPTRRTALFAGLRELADEDPLIGLRIDEHDGEAAVSLHGEVQKEVIAALLEERYGVCARFLDTSVMCVERVVGTGESVDRIKERANPYLAGIGLRIEAAPVGHGVEFSPGIERGNLPPAFIAATEEGVRSALRQGLLGWPVTDCVVTMTESGYYPRQSKPHQKFDKSVSSVAADFRNLAPVVLAAALSEAGTRVCQPIDRFEMDVPDEATGSVAALLGRLGGLVTDTSVTGGYLHLVGTIPAAARADLTSRLPDLTSGEGAVAFRTDHYAPVRSGRPPSRRRRGADPRDREAWFRDVPR